MEALSREFRLGLQWKMLHSDDLKITDEKLHSLVSKLKGQLRVQRVDMRKEIMFRLMHQNTSVAFVRKLTLCQLYEKWVNKCCSDTKGKLSTNIQFKVKPIPILNNNINLSKQLLVKVHLK